MTRSPPWMRTWALRLAGAALLAGALAWLPYRVYHSEGYVRYRQMRDQLGDLERGNQALREENRRRRQEIHRLRFDLDAIGQAARDDLGLVKPGEIVIQIDRGAQAGGAQGGAQAP